ncbi:hypothetical protein BDR22DRAFT_888305 [Usnea florida]
MSFNQEVPRSYEDFIPHTFNLAAHTAIATALDYIKLAYISIVKTTDDDLTAILAQASYDEPATSPPDKKKENLYLCFSASLLGFISLSAPVSRHSVLLDPDGFKKTLTFMKESHRADQLLVAQEDDIVGPKYLKMVVTHEEYREGDTYAVIDSRPSTSSPGGRYG